MFNRLLWYCTSDSENLRIFNHMRKTKNWSIPPPTLGGMDISLTAVEEGAREGGDWRVIFLQAAVTRLSNTMTTEG